MEGQRYIVNVEGAIVHDGRYLLVVRGEEEEHAAGVLALVGGKLEGTDEELHACEDCLRREIREEVGVEVGEMTYLYNNIFGAEPVLDIIYLCRYASGAPTITDPGEVAEILWLTAAEAHAHPAAPPWLHTQLEHAEIMRQRLDW